ncbi:peptide deformylase [Caminicella sporogenes DSM 14501]|uniref:Peptide deformylase n=1 Tax=Caminicella sporogenes DSM 14501 TaxID=1121266 RepID=A0A1M6LI38_9FIRM|nr:peptide deformylase [Caminicella sporogenes]RKD27837.1 peptide deformylase [Caminicella sporogenes]SHJ70837.1 peptide deformylase [Caminicella sporogenes DSM 14501]
MAIRNIRKNDDPILRKVSKTVDKIDDKIKELIDDMAETMYNADGVGLAAPQVGILKRVIVIDIGGGLIELINPEILSEKGKQIDIEGCLSVPNVTGKVERPERVKVKGLDRNGEEVIIEAKGFLARAFCHEIDHLNGILFVDKLIEE